MDALVRSSSTSTAIGPFLYYNDTPEGRQTLVWHQAHAREDWHRKLADFKKKKAKVLSIHKQRHPSPRLTGIHCTFTPHAPHLLVL